MKKLEREVLHIYDPVFRTNFYYIMAPDQKVLCEVMKRRLNINATAKDRTQGRFMTAMRGECLVGIIWQQKPQVDILAHEVMHAVAWELGEKGIPLTFESEEAYAYLTQFLTRQVTDYWKARCR